MDMAFVTLILALIEKAIQYGPAAVTAAIEALNKTEITIEDIQGLKITKEPEEY
jgi:hypothetical protein